MTSSTPTMAVTLLQEQIDAAKPDLVIHGVSSSISLAMLPLLTCARRGVRGRPHAEYTLSSSRRVHGNRRSRQWPLPNCSHRVAK